MDVDKGEVDVDKNKNGSNFFEEDDIFPKIEKKIVIPTKEKKKKRSKFNSYIAFIKDHVVEKELKKEYPEKTFGELSKIKSKMWKNLSPEKKESYKIKAKELTEKNNTN